MLLCEFLIFTQCKSFFLINQAPWANISTLYEDKQVVASIPSDSPTTIISSFGYQFDKYTKINVNMTDVYAYEFNQTGSTVSLIGEFPPLLYQKLRTYSISSDIIPDTKYVISLNPLNENFQPINVNNLEFGSIFKSEYEVYISDCEYIPFTSGECSRYIAIILSNLGLVMLILRVIYFAKSKTVIVSEEAGFWFASSTGAAISPYPRNINISSLFNAWKIINSKPRKPICKIIQVRRFPTAIFQTRILVTPYPDGIYSILIWTNMFVEDEIFLDLKINEGILRIDDHDQPIKAEIQLKNPDEGFSFVEIPAEVDGEKMKITISSDTHDKMPLTQYSMTISHVDRIHLTAFKAGLSHMETFQDFEQFCEVLYERLDYSLITLYTSNNHQWESIVSFMKDPEIAKYAMEFVMSLPPLAQSHSPMTSTISCYRFGGCRFQVAYVEYAFVCAMPAAGFILRHNELRFQYLMSIIIGFHHTIIASRAEQCAMLRLRTLLDQIGINVAEYESPPPGSYGEALYNIMRESKMMKRIIPFPDGKSLFVALSKHYDETILSNIFTEFSEDMTPIHKVKSLERTLKCISKANIFEIYQASCDVNQPIEKSFAIKLGYNPDDQVTFASILSPKDAELVSKMPIFGFSLIRIYPPSMIPIRYGILRATLHFFVIPFPELSEINAIPSPDILDQAQLDLISNKFQIFVVDVLMGTTIVHSFEEVNGDPANDKDFSEVLETDTIHPQLAKLLSHIHPDDINTFVDNFKHSRKNNSNCIVPLRIIQSQKTFWYFITINSNDENYALIWHNAGNYLELTTLIQERMKNIDIINSHAQIFKMIFEDAAHPDRIFTSLPGTSKSTLIINWSTVSHNVLQSHRSSITRAIKTSLMSGQEVCVLLPIQFDSLHWFFFRGSVCDEKVTNDQKCLRGVGIEMTKYVQEKFTQNQSYRAACKDLSNFIDKLCEDGTIVEDDIALRDEALEFKGLFKELVM